MVGQDGVVRFYNFCGHLRPEKIANSNLNFLLESKESCSLRREVNLSWYHSSKLWKSRNSEARCTDQLYLSFHILLAQSLNVSQWLGIIGFSGLSQACALPCICTWSFTCPQKCCIFSKVTHFNFQVLLWSFLFVFEQPLVCLNWYCCLRQLWWGTISIDCFPQCLEA